jgi:hypothetical protein
MSSGIARGPVTSLLPIQHSSIQLSLTRACRRNGSSFRRTKRQLRVKPDDSFLHSPKSARQDHIVFNPPPSSPSVYHTPLKFVPVDYRRQGIPPAIRRDTSAYQLPPAINEPYQKRYHLTLDDIAEARRLRTENPDLWTRDRLAKQFKCSSLFIGIVCEATQERKEQQEKVLEDVKSHWGRRRRTAREDRARRRESWGRDE